MILIIKRILYPLLRTLCISKQFHYLPASLQALNFRQSASQRKTSNRHIYHAWLTLLFSQKHLAQRLANIHHLYRDNQKHEIISKLKAEAQNTGIHWHKIALTRYNETFIKHSIARNYNSWIEQSEKPNLPSSKAIAQALEAMALQPLISVLLPIYNANENQLHQCIASVLNQSYPHWQLCITCDTSTLDHTKTLLEKYAAGDKRIELFFCKTNKDITAASKDALALVHGDYVALLNHNGLLAKHALYRIIEELNKSPQAAIFYSDEDKIDINSNRFEPNFKPDWNPDLLLSQNYISHLAIYKAELIKTINGFRVEVEGNQNHDLLLHCTSQLKDEQIVHIPEILYHWRFVEGSTSSYSSENTNPNNTEVKALAYRFGHSAAEVKIEAGMLPNTYRIRWPIPRPPPLVSLIIPTRDGYQVLKQCVDSILEKTTYANYEIIILNNQSSCPDTLSYLQSISADHRVTIHPWDHEFNYSAINNFGATLAKGSILGLLNNDIKVINGGWLEEMVSHACRDDIGCVGAKLYYLNDTIQHAGIILGIGGIADHVHKHFCRNEPGYCSRLKLVQNLSAVTGACLLVRKSVFEEVKGLNENLAIAFNDVDFCLKVREAGYRNLWTPYAELYHHESVSRGANDTRKKRTRLRREADYMRKHWGSALHTDPAYNPNLTLIRTDFSPK